MQSVGSLCGRHRARPGRSKAASRGRFYSFMACPRAVDSVSSRYRSSPKRVIVQRRSKSMHETLYRRSVEFKHNLCASCIKVRDLKCCKTQATRCHKKEENDQLTRCRGDRENVLAVLVKNQRWPRHRVSVNRGIKAPPADTSSQPLLSVTLSFWTYVVGQMSYGTGKHEVVHTTQAPRLSRCSYFM